MALWCKRGLIQKKGNTRIDNVLINKLGSYSERGKISELLGNKKSPRNQSLRRNLQFTLKWPMKILQPTAAQVNQQIINSFSFHQGRKKSATEYQIHNILRPCFWVLSMRSYTRWLFFLYASEITPFKFSEEYFFQVTCKQRFRVSLRREKFCSFKCLELSRR